MDVLCAEAVLVAVFDEAFRGIDHEDSLPRLCIILVEDDDARGDARAVEEIRREADDPFDIAAPHDLATDDGLGAAAEQHAVWEVHRGFPSAL